MSSEEGIQELYLAIYLETLEKAFETLKRGYKNLNPQSRKVMKDILIHFQQECFKVLEGKKGQFPLNPS